MAKEKAQNLFPHPPKFIKTSEAPSLSSPLPRDRCSAFTEAFFLKVDFIFKNISIDMIASMLGGTEKPLSFC